MPLIMVDTYRLFSHRILMLISMLGCAVSVDAQALKLERQVIGAAGRTVSSGGLTLEWTAGQVSASLLKPVSGTGPDLQQGFHQGLCDLQGTLSITANADTLTCDKTSIQLNGVTNIPGIQQTTWILPGGSQSSGTSISATLPGTYSYVVLRDGCSRETSITLIQDTIKPTLNITPDGPPVLTCLQPDIQLSGSSATDALFLWSTGESLSSITVNNPATYSLTVTNPENGCTQVKSISISEDKSKPSINPLTDLTLDCTADSLQISAGSVTPGVSFQWISPSGAMLPSGPSQFAKGTGTYTIIVTSPNGCTAVDSLVIIPAQDVPEINLSGPLKLTCTVPSITLLATSNFPSVSFTWTNTAGSSSTGAQFSTSTPGIYTLVVLNPATQCKNERVLEVVSDTISPNLSIEPTDTLNCKNNSSLLLVLLNNPQSGVTYSYLWRSPAGLNQSTSVPTLSVTEGGQWQVTVTNQENGCSNAISLNVISSKTNPDVQMVEMEKDCEKAVLTAIGPDVDNVTFQWFPGANNPTTPEWTVEKSGTYTLLVTDQNGCSTQSTLSVELLTESLLSFISPNEDGKNDRLKVNRCGSSGSYEVTIFNRWGQLVIQTKDFEQDFPLGWDGTYNGQTLPDGQYYYIVEQGGIVSKSPLTILRYK